VRQPTKAARNPQPVDSERTVKKKNRTILLKTSPSVVEPVTAAAVASIRDLVLVLAAAVVLEHVSDTAEVIPPGVVGRSPSVDREPTTDPEAGLEPHRSTSPPSSEISAPNLVSTSMRS